MTDQTAIVPFEETMKLGEVLARSGYFDDAKGAAQAVVKVLAGKELGFGPIASMTGIHIVKGKPTIGGNLMAAAVKRNPRYDYKVIELTDNRCAIDFYENGQKVGTSTFTKEDAARAGTQNMGKFPRNMLFNRAMSNGVKWFCPDVFSGSPVYTPDELGAEVDDDGAIIDVTVVEDVQSATATNGDAEFDALPGHERSAYQADGEPWQQWRDRSDAFEWAEEQGFHERHSLNIWLPIQKEHKIGTKEMMEPFYQAIKTRVEERAKQEAMRDDPKAQIPIGIGDDGPTNAELDALAATDS